MKKNNRNKSAIRLLKKRLARDNFFGLTFTALIVVFTYVFVIFGAVISNYWSFAQIFALDRQLDSFLATARTTNLIHFFLLITALALPQFAIGVSAAFAAFLSLKNKRSYLLPFLVSVIGGMAINLLSKLSIQRGRPLDGVYFESSYSFPSGHATLAVVLYGFIFYYFWKKAKTGLSKNLLLLLGTILILFIGFSRIYLGVHFLSDVLAGYLLGLIWLCAGIGLAEWRLEKKRLKLITQ